MMYFGNLNLENMDIGAVIIVLTARLTTRIKMIFGYPIPALERRYWA